MIILLLIYNLLALPIIISVSIILSIFNKKIRKGFLGRLRSISSLKSFSSEKFSNIYWFHSSSYGEYQQVETLIDKLKKSDPNIGIITSFFSPSGFENVKDDNIDLKIYLPFDFILTSYKALKLIKPKKIFFTSSDFWPSFLFVANNLNITTILTSARYRNSYKIFLNMFDMIFCVSDNDCQLMKRNIKNDKITVTGNPRYDRILNNLNNVKYKIKSDINEKNKILILASMWMEDNKIIFENLINSSLINNFEKIIIVPHEISEKYINYYCSAFEKRNFTYKLIDNYQNFETLAEKFIIVNKVGFLSKLYLQTSITYVGGGFSKSGIHNIIEPAAASNPVIFGTNFLNSNQLDAQGLINVCGGFSIESFNAFKEKINWLLNMENYKYSSDKCKSFVLENSGSTEKIIEVINE
tara:strand:- start:6043 stop:7278 length:1236 start_codon:yes stop_codon:yes gene_type:complete